MDYEFKSDIRTADYWILSMYNTYHSLVGVVNIVFFASMVALCYRFWNVVKPLPQAFMFLGLILIPIIHPFGVYLKSKSQMLLVPKDGVTLKFGMTGIRVIVGDKEEMIRWNKVRGVTERCGMVIIYSDAAHGYILTRRVLGKKKEEFIKYLKEKIASNKK